MTCKRYLLIIDEVPFESIFCDYFAKFDFAIKQYTQLPALDPKNDLPAAIIIHYNIILTSALIVNELYHLYPVPLVIIGDKNNDEICVQMLDAGADDFISKPIHPRELHARISAINKRVLKATQAPDQEKEILQFANCKLYPGSRQLFTEQQELLLSTNEYDLLLVFVRQPQHVLSREFLLQVTTNNDLNPLDRRIDVQISRLRHKIEPNVKRPELIKTIRNSGYMFTAKVLSNKSSSLRSNGYLD